jgi:hypothetical protein
MSRNIPNVPFRVDDPPNSVSPGLVRNWKKNPRPGRYGPLNYRIDVADVQIDDDWRAAIQLRSATRQV